MKSLSRLAQCTFLLASTAQSFRPFQRNTGMVQRLSSTSNLPLPPVAKGAVAITVRCSVKGTPHFLLIQRGKEPNKGMWSLPGGSIEFGEHTLIAAHRELGEETIWEDTSIFKELQWHPTAVCTSDSISDGYHYLIAQFFANIDAEMDALPKVEPADDAMDAKWCTIDEIDRKILQDKATAGVRRVIGRIEELVSNELLPTARIDQH